MIYNPKNAAQMLKSMKNKTQTRKDKIAARIKYEQQQAQKYDLTMYGISYIIPYITTERTNNEYI